MDVVQAQLQAAFGRGRCNSVCNLVTMGDFETALADSSLDVAQPSSSTIRSADTRCGAVLTQLGHVEKIHASAMEAVDLLEQQCRKALIAARGVEVRAVRVDRDAAAAMALRQGVCHTRVGAVIGIVTQAAVDAGCAVGDVVVSIDGDCMLGESSTEVERRLRSGGSNSAHIVELVKATDLACGLSLRTRTGGAWKSCAHIAEVNKWISSSCAALPQHRRKSVCGTFLCSFSVSRFYRLFLSLFTPFCLISSCIPRSTYIVNTKFNILYFYEHHQPSHSSRSSQR